MAHAKQRKPVLKEATNLFGQTALGESVALAKINLVRLEAEYAKRLQCGVRLFNLGPALCLIAPDPHGWSYQIFPENGRTLRADGTFYAISTAGDFLDAWRSVTCSVLQRYWARECTDDIAYVEAIVDQAVPVLADYDGQGLSLEVGRVTSEFLRWAGWQRAYWALRDQGATDRDAHEYASHPGDWRRARATA